MIVGTGARTVRMAKFEYTDDAALIGIESCNVARQRGIAFMNLRFLKGFLVLLLYNTIQSNLFQLSYMSIIIIIHCIFLNEKSKRICRKLNKLIRDIPRTLRVYNA